MGTVIDRVAVTEGGWRNRHSALRLAVQTAKDCLHAAGRGADDVDLLINAGIYRDRNLGEPALAAMIQQDIGANPEDPHAHGHGTFSFDIANGSCGVLTALQIVDGFLKSHAIDCALVVTSDADPGHGMSENFPFSPAGAALLCNWADDGGVEGVHWVNVPDEGESFNATVGLVDGRNVLRFGVSDDHEDQFAAAAAQAADKCLRASSLELGDVDAIIAAPAGRRYRAALARHLGVPAGQIVVADDEDMNTASLAAAFDRAAPQFRAGDRVLLIAAGAGIAAGAALYRVPSAGGHPKMAR
ncbi:3-oxoacyl-[acyl-carrier-protein] synthase III C-terminal domain-containing protein [Mycobacterium sp.]|uniref:3-oxoacyl-[acyl-carrier-protein] synthase III C-terminal domain-containing protein n=1 Tax=Mycobacterium sp. TaxID=1785 RepID=UPI002C119F2B|nr:3-oxoacyl-[acyl-carrier-protein] synthase III C-terminal domain-containing protein [Mycobacterium sp.]HKP44896.1 3-oxoacyl-[acyl-carrier-protein] synthase III C-terminal domain-containing protein [Mycobacterium sp.]